MFEILQICEKKNNYIERFRDFVYICCGHNPVSQDKLSSKYFDFVLYVVRLSKSTKWKIKLAEPFICWKLASLISCAAWIWRESLHNLVKEKEYLLVNVDNKGKIQFHDKIHNLVFILNESSHTLEN